MANYVLVRLCCLVTILFLSVNTIYCSGRDDERKVYIVYMGSLPTETVSTYSPTSHHLSLLQEIVGEESSALLVRSYKRSLNGFAAKLTENEAQKLASKEEVVSVFPNQIFHVQTTRSWDFIGLPETAKREPTVEGNTVIGVIDSGVDPTVESFSDKGFGSPPKKWKGSCEGGVNVTCNNKIIGARYYGSAGVVTAFDYAGHGTHTASTAAGNAVLGANFFDLANGTARGGVPSSRIAVYTVCDSVTCSGEAILAAFDDAIADGVDIITISIGQREASSFDQDPVAIGAFHAVAKGILVAQSAGNDGPGAGTVSSVAPWLLTVAASSIDRKFITKLVLGDGTVLSGPSINGFPSSKSIDLLFGMQVTGKGSKRDCNAPHAEACWEECLDPQKVAGKILICRRGNTPFFAAKFNVSGVILTIRFPDVAFSHALPAAVLDNSSFEKVVSYHNSTRNPRAKILKGEVDPNPASPAVAVFSSRGPNQITRDIMKPDVSAPGTDILAAYPPTVPPTLEGGDWRSVKFNVISGTSMSCPHVAGAAAYVKSFHPDWSPSAIKSALMTTASKMSVTNTKGEAPQHEYSYGSGQINPVKAVDPGLVYEITKDDHLRLLCSLGVKVSAIDSNSTCVKGAKNMTAAELNYPSFSFSVPISKPFKLALNRTVTNVGPLNSTYKAKVVASSNLNITVVPDVISFKTVNEKKSFTVEITGSKLESGTQLSQEIVWFDGARSVRSPIIVYTDS